MTMCEEVAAYGYKVVTWQEFISASDKPQGLLERASALVQGTPYPAFVVYDPLDDCQGWFVIGDDRDSLIRETFDRLDA